MSSNLNYKQAENVTRRTWDRETYEARARARTDMIEQDSNRENPSSTSTFTGTANDNDNAGDKRRLLLDDEEPLEEEFTPAIAGAVGPYKSRRAFLKARSKKVDLESKVGSSEMVSIETVATSSTGENEPISIKDGITKTGVGWHCKVCDCFLKDSLTYLDHINGRKHQKSLGYSMRVRKSTKNQVLAKLSEMAKEEEEEDINLVVTTNFEDVVKAKDKDTLRIKAERARKREERKQRLKQEEEEETEEGMDPDMAAMMGFGGFGGGNKNG